MARWEPDAADRLMAAAITLFDERGYEATTVADIAAAAGLTKRTYFRHFADKREVLFSGSHETEDAWTAAVRDAPSGVEALDAITAGFDPLAAFFDTLHPAARTRSRIVGANAELAERETGKLEALAAALGDALRSRGVPDHHAHLAARVGIVVYQDAFARWVEQDDPGAGVLRRLLDESLAELRTVLRARGRK